MIGGSVRSQHCEGETGICHGHARTDLEGRVFSRSLTSIFKKTVQKTYIYIHVLFIYGIYNMVFTVQKMVPILSQAPKHIIYYYIYLYIYIGVVEKGSTQ